MDIGPRVLVVGTTGAGKTALAARLARRLGGAPIELDEFEHGPDWTERSAEEMCSRTAAAVDGVDVWVRSRCKWQYESVAAPHGVRARDCGPGIRARSERGRRGGVAILDGLAGPLSSVGRALPW